MLKKVTKLFGQRFHWPGFLALAVLLLASLACNFGAASQPPQDATPIPVTTESVEELKENIEEAATQANTTGRVTIVVDEAQLTSLIAFELEKQEEEVLKDPQVYLRDGQIQLYGNAVQRGVTLPVSVIATVSVDERGLPHYEILSATAGPVPIPQSMLDELTAQLDHAINSRLNPDESDMVIEDITIADGKMTVTGRKR